MATQTDNHNPRVKLDLRRYFLRKYHTRKPPHVLDCCQGGGVLWSALREEFSVASYWGLDLKPKKGRLKLDSVRVLSQPGWTQDVIDVDTYGSPWKHWVAIIANLTAPATVFLTIGQSCKGMTRMPREMFHALGLSGLSLISPSSDFLSTLQAKLTTIGASYCLTMSCDKITIIEAVEASSTGNARYIGVRIEPRQNTNGQQVRTAGRPKHSRAAKEPANV